MSEPFPVDAPVIGVASDLYIESEPDYWNRIQRVPARWDSSQVDRSLQRRQALRREPGHPKVGPDLRALKLRQIDLLLLAGGIDHGVKSVEYADQAAKYLGCPVCLIAGNHEYWGRDMAAVSSAMDFAARATNGRVTFLDNGWADFTIRGKRVAVLGTTLWTDYRQGGKPAAAMEYAIRRLNDHALFHRGERHFTPDDALYLHEESLDWLGEVVPKAKAEADYVIVMTHHAPIPQANPLKYQDELISASFASDLREQIIAWQPDLWVWGHTHFSMSAELGVTRLVSAQRGRMGGEESVFFLPKILELQRRGDR